MYAKHLLTSMILENSPIREVEMTSLSEILISVLLDFYHLTALLEYIWYSRPLDPFFLSVG